MPFVAQEKACTWKGPARWPSSGITAAGRRLSLLQAPSGWGAHCQESGPFTKENNCVRLTNFVGKSWRPVSLRKWIFTNTDSSWTSIFRFRLPFCLEREQFWKLGQWLLLLILSVLYVLQIKWTMKSLERNKTCQSLWCSEGSFRVNISRFLWNPFIYMGKCWPCVFGSGEINAPPFLTAVSFGSRSLDVGPCLLGMGGW